MSKEFAWSYSALTRFEQCPKQFYKMNVTKEVKDEGNEFTEEGQAIHQGLYNRIIKDRPLPLNYRYLEATAAKFVGLPGETSGELKFAMSRAFEPVQYFDRSVFVRVIVDLLNVQGDRALVVDWKTGKPKPGFTQLELTAAVLSTHLPEIQTFKTAYVWLQDKSVTSKVIQKSELVSVWNHLLPRVKKIEDAAKLGEYPMKPSPLCRYCPVTDCANWKPRDG